MNSNKRHLLITTSLALAWSTQAHADVDRINSPIVTENEFEVYYNGTRTDDSKGSKTNKQVNEFALEYGLDDDWKIEAGAELKRDNKDDADPTNVFLEFVRQTTDQKDGWWLSSGILAEYVHDLDGDSDKWKLSGLFQHKSGKWKHRLNVNFSEEFEDRTEEVKVVTRWGSYYKLTKLFQPGAEWHATFGNLGDLEFNGDQEHYVGPIIGSEFAEWTGPDGTPHALSMKIGHMFSVSDGTPADGISRLKLEYTTEF